MNTVQTFFSAIPALLPASLDTVVFILLTVVLVLLVALVVRLESRVRNISAPTFEQIVHEARQKAEKILAEAEVESRDLRVQAQKEAEKMFNDRKSEDEAFRRAQEKHLEMITAHAKELLDAQTKTISDLSARIASEFKEQAIAAEKAMHDESAAMQQILSQESEHMKQIFATISANVERDYQALVVETRKRITEEPAKEVDAAKKAINAYRQERFAMLNKQIVDLVEDTTRIALNRSLSLEDHRGIILDALKEAKRRGVFGSPS